MHFGGTNTLLFGCKPQTNLLLWSKWEQLCPLWPLYSSLLPFFLILTFSPGCCFPMNPCVIGVDISLADQVSGDSVFSSGRYETAGLSPSRPCWWSHLFLHINSILSPDQGQTPAFHCSGEGVWGCTRGRGLAGPPADVITLTKGIQTDTKHTHADTPFTPPALDSYL